MNRLLLALLALLAGFAAQIAPAQALAVGSESAAVGSVETARCARPCAAPSQGADAPGARQDRREKETIRSRPPRQRVVIPAVFLGVDRAYE
jgi:hypothetical protein